MILEFVEINNLDLIQKKMAHLEVLLQTSNSAIANLKCASSCKSFLSDGARHTLLANAGLVVSHLLESRFLSAFCMSFLRQCALMQQKKALQ